MYSIGIVLGTERLNDGQKVLLTVHDRGAEPIKDYRVISIIVLIISLTGMITAEVLGLEQKVVALLVLPFSASALMFILQIMDEVFFYKSMVSFLEREIIRDYIDNELEKAVEKSREEAEKRNG